MQLTKQQVKALLDVMSSDVTRPVLTNAYVDKYEGRTVLVVTDGYKLAALDVNLPDSTIGKVVKREDLIRWYKLANTKDFFTEEAITELLSDLDGTYPQWQGLIPKERSEAGSISLNAKFMLQLETLAGGKPLVYVFTGDKPTLSPVIATRQNENAGLYVIMPVKQ